MTPEELEPKQGISRRKMIKRIGAGAAIAWTAPILTSIRTPAFATGGGGGCGGTGACDPGQTCQPACDVLRPCHAPNNCACFPSVTDASCVCGDLKDGLCASFQPCTTQADCTGGGCCVASCCPTGICLPACAGARKRAQAKGGVKLYR
jgi:hypothetical protein